MNEEINNQQSAPPLRERELLPEVRAELDAPKEVRLKRVGKEVYIPTAGTERILDKAERLIAYGGEGMLITGPSGCSKTRTLDELEWRHPKISALDAAPETVRIPVLRVVIPASADRRGFLGAIIHGFGFRDYESETYDERKLRAIRLLENEQFGVELIAVDEFQHLLAGVRMEMQKTLNLLKDLQSAVNIPMILAGLSGEGKKGIDVETILEWDPQLARRFPRYELQRMTDGKPYRNFLWRREGTFPFRFPSRLWDDEKALYILKRSSGIRHYVVRGTGDAGRLAILDDSDCIEMEHLKKAEFTSLNRIEPSSLTLPF